MHTLYACSTLYAPALMILVLFFRKPCGAYAGIFMWWRIGGWRTLWLHAARLPRRLVRANSMQPGAAGASARKLIHHTEGLNPGNQHVARAHASIQQQAMRSDRGDKSCLGGRTPPPPHDHHRHCQQPCDAEEHPRQQHVSHVRLPHIERNGCAQMTAQPSDCAACATERRASVRHNVEEQQGGTVQKE